MQDYVRIQIQNARERVHTIQIFFVEKMNSARIEELLPNEILVATQKAISFPFPISLHFDLGSLRLLAQCPSGIQKP
jgi:hypothetical protein